MAHSVPDAVAVVIDDAGRPRAAHGRLEARPHAGRRPARPTSAGSPSSATAASTSCSATRRTPSGPASPAPSGSSARRSASSSRAARAASSSPRSPPTSTACSRRSTSRVEAGRKVAVVGRSMRKNLNIARNLGYMDVPDDALIQPDELDELPPRQGADPLHGQPGRAAVGADADRLRRPPDGQVERGDTVIISARPVPGNELRVHDTINRLDARPAPRCCTRRTRPSTSPATRSRRSCGR